MTSFDPFLAFRYLLFVVSSGLFLWQTWEIVLWYRDLPSTGRKYLLLVLLRGRWRAFGLELVAVVFLSGVWLWLVYLNLAGLAAEASG